MSGKKEKIATKKALPLEAMWRLRLACLNAAERLRADKDSNRTPTQPQALWVSVEKELTQSLRHHIDHKAQKSSFFVEDFDAIALDISFSLMAQMDQGRGIDLNTLARWGSYTSHADANEALKLLDHWQNRFRLDHDLVQMLRSLAWAQKSLFEHAKEFHLYSDGQTLTAVCEGLAADTFQNLAPQQLLDLERLPHSLLFNPRDGHNAQIAAIWPLTAPMAGILGRLRCLIILQPSREKAPISLPSAG